MTQSIEDILSQPTNDQETKYNIITTMSKDMNKWYSSLKNTIVWWGNKKTTTAIKKKILAWQQITLTWEQREDSWSQKRSPKV